MSIILLVFAIVIPVHLQIPVMRLFSRIKGTAISTWRRLREPICRINFGRRSVCPRTTSRLWQLLMRTWSFGVSSSVISASSAWLSCTRWSLDRESWEWVTCIRWRRWLRSISDMRRESLRGRRGLRRPRSWKGRLRRSYLGGWRVARSTRRKYIISIRRRLTRSLRGSRYKKRRMK